MRALYAPVGTSHVHCAESERVSTRPRQRLLPPNAAPAAGADASCCPNISSDSSFEIGQSGSSGISRGPRPHAVHMDRSKKPRNPRKRKPPRRGLGPPESPGPVLEMRDVCPNCQARPLPGEFVRGPTRAWGPCWGSRPAHRSSRPAAGCGPRPRSPTTPH